MKVILHYRASPVFRTILEEATPNFVSLSIVDDTDDAGFLAAMKDADVLLHVLRPVARTDIEGAPKLQLIQKIGVGINTIDLNAAKERGVAICNMPGTNSQAVAEMTLMLMLAALRRVAIFDPLTRAGNGWKPDTNELDRVGEVAGRIVGFVGYGAVPARLAPVLRALGANIIYHAREPKPDAIGRFVQFDDLLSQSDIVSLHVPSTPQTRGIIDASAISRMKDGAILINTARGDLVDEVALSAALTSGHLAGAGLDVFAREPALAGNPLFALPNVTLMPHIAWLTPETLRRSMSIAFENCRRINAGEDLLHKVV